MPALFFGVLFPGGADGNPFSIRAVWQPSLTSHERHERSGPVPDAISLITAEATTGSFRRRART